MKPLRILHIGKYITTYPGGIERATLAMAQAGRELGHSVKVLSVRPAGFSPDNPSNLSENEKALDSLFQLGPISLTGGYFRNFDTVLASDLIHVHLPNPTAELMLRCLLPRLKNQKTLLVPIIHAPIVRWKELGKIWHRLFETPILNQSDTIIVGSDRILNYFDHRTSWSSNVTVLPHAIVNPRPVSNVPPTGATRLLTVGRLVSYKGFDFLVKGLAAVPGHWHLDIVGSGPEYGRILNTIQRLNLSNKVTLHGTVSDETKTDLMGNCDIYLQPSLTEAESFGIAIGEAFSYGKPVVVSDLKTGTAFMSRQGACGAVFETNNPESFQQALTPLLDSPALRQQIGQNNFEFYHRELSLSVYAARYQKLLEGLMLPHRPARDKTQKAA